VLSRLWRALNKTYLLVCLSTGKTQGPRQEFYTEPLHWKYRRRVIWLLSSF